MIPLSRGLKSWYFLGTVAFVLFQHSVFFFFFFFFLCITIHDKDLLLLFLIRC